MHRRRLPSLPALPAIVVLALFATASPAAAQTQAASDSGRVPPEETSRREKLIDLRHAKLAHLEPPETSAWEETVAWVERKRKQFMGSGHTSFLSMSPVLGGIRSGAGETVGLRLRLARDNPGRQLALSARGSIKRYWSLKAETGIRLSPLFGYGFAQHRHMPRESFYGIGDVDGATEANFLHDETVGGALAGFQLAPRVMAGALGAYMINDLGAGKAPNLPTVSEQYAAEAVPAFGRGVDYFIYGAFAELDLRDHEIDRDYGARFAPTERRLRGLSLDARRGLYFAAEANHFSDRAGGAFSFTRLDLDAHQYLPFRNAYHVIALRQLLTLSRVDSGDAVPYYLMETIGGKRTIRGFDEHRFRDLNALVLNAEYRYQVWVLLDLALFADAGQVFRQVEELAWSEMEKGYGIGLRFKTPSELFARVDFARSREGFAVEISFGSIL